MSTNVMRRYIYMHKGFLALSMRERLLILFSGILLFIFVGYLWLIEPAYINMAKLTKARTQQASEIVLFESEIQALNAQIHLDPNIKLQQKIARLDDTKQNLEQKLSALTGDLVPANMMPQLLENLLSKSSSLKLINLQSIPPRQMTDTTKDQTAQTSLYQHGVVLIFEGRYFDIQTYLAELETLPWRFYWKKFDYKVTQHPIAQVELELYTLSTNKAFLGV